MGCLVARGYRVDFSERKTMIWIILGLLPIIYALALIAYNDPEAFLVIVGSIGVCVLMSLSITYGLYQLFGSG